MKRRVLFRTTPASMSSCPTAGRYGQNISSGATVDAVWSVKQLASNSPVGDPTASHLIAEVEVAEEPEWGIRHDTAGVHSLSRLDDDGLVRVLVTEQHLGRTNEPTLRDLSEALIAVYGTDYGIHNPIWISRFTDMTRQA